MLRILPLCLLSLVLALPAGAQRPMKETTELSTLTVQGSGEARVDPDEASVRLGVTRQAETAQEAQQEVNQTAQAILEAIVRLGVVRDEIQTSRLTLFPIYAPERPNSPQEPRLVAYRAANVVSVRLQKLDLVGRVIDAGLKAGANQLEGVSFNLRNDQAARESALKDAVREARAKAKTISDALDVRLLEVHEVQEGGVIVQPFFAPGGGAERMMAANIPTPVSPGQVTVNASVTVRYRIQSRGQ